MNTDFYRDKTVWLTGASSGIGAAVADKLIDAGARLIVSGRDGDALAKLTERAPERVFALAFDVADAGERERAIREMRALTDHLHLAILNAGTCRYIEANNFDPDICRDMMRINFEGTSYCIDMALPLLRAQREKDPGQRVTLAAVASMASYCGLPRAEAYGASKAAVNYLLDSLRVDLRRSGIDVCAINPGFVKTPLTDRNDFPMPFLLSSEQAAQRMVDGLARGAASIHFPWRLHALLKVFSALPQRWRAQLLQSAVRS